MITLLCFEWSLPGIESVIEIKHRRTSIDNSNRFFSVECNGTLVINTAPYHVRPYFAALGGTMNRQQALSFTTRCKESSGHHYLGLTRTQDVVVVLGKVP